MKTKVLWSTIVKLCGRPVVVNQDHKGMKLVPHTLVTIFHGEGRERDWAEVGKGYVNVVERVIFPEPIPEKYRDKIIVGINYDDLVMKDEDGNYRVPVTATKEKLTIKRLIAYLPLFNVSDAELAVGGDFVRCFSFQDGFISLDDADCDSF